MPGRPVAGGGILRPHDELARRDIDLAHAVARQDADLHQRIAPAHERASVSAAKYSGRSQPDAASVRDESEDYQDECEDEALERHMIYDC